MVAASPATAGPLQQGMAAYQRHDFVTAERLLRPLAERGNAQAQTALGFMHEYGRGAPQSYTEAAIWYCLAAEQGYAQAQYLLGLLYNKGHGVPRDYVEAHKWLNLAAARAPKRDREYWIRVRDSVASKMTEKQIMVAQVRAVGWYPKRLTRKAIIIGRLRTHAVIDVE